MSAKRKPAKRPAGKASGNRTTTTTGTLLGSLITINFGGRGKSRRRGGGLTGLLAGLLKAFSNGGGGGGGGKADRPGRGDVDDRLGGGLDQAPPDTGRGVIAPGRGLGGELGGQGTAGQRTHGPRRAR